MEDNKMEKLYDLLNSMKVTQYNKSKIEKIKQCLKNNDFIKALELLRILQSEGDNSIKETKTSTRRPKKDKNVTIYNGEDQLEDEKLYQRENEDEGAEEDNLNEKQNNNEQIYPKTLQNQKLEQTYIAMLLNDVKAISRYYFLFDECFFADEDMLNIYKEILFTEGESYASEAAKRKFNFAKNLENINEIKSKLKKSAEVNKCSFEKVYIDLKKLFILRKSYMENPIKTIQDKIIEILDYELYDQMTIEEVESAVEQVTVTQKFKRAILNENITDFLVKGDNKLTNGISLQFPILSSVFKGIRKGETMAFAMPSNSGKSRFTINLAIYVAFVHKKKVLIISNEMSEEKTRLCLITTIINNPEIQKMHGQFLTKTEGELLEFKFRPDNIKNVKVDKDGFVLREENEKQIDFAKRLSKISSEYNKTIAATDWLNKEINNSIYFINITDHTNDELQKVIMNYYYKEKIEYVFYDTLKTDIENIGNGDELKKTATILSNLAQNFNMFIGATLQLAETNTLPINLNINDLAVSRTVKEVLDTLCLLKQIHRENFEDYEYSLEEVDTKFYDIEKFKDPDIRYYTCVVDKNRAGAKPTVVFKLNLAYNRWEELGYLRFKQTKKK